MRGKFITFEGIDGAGKSSHIEAVKLHLAKHGIDVRTTREPGGTPLGETIRELFLHHEMSPRTEALLVFAARREHLEKEIWPKLDAGIWVLCDRFTDASFAYQGGGRELGSEAVRVLASWVHPGFVPDLTLLFDLPPDAAKTRVDTRGQLDRIEKEKEDFHARVRAAYLAQCTEEPDRITVFDSSESIDTVRTKVLARVDRLIEAASGGAQ